MQARASSCRRCLWRKCGWGFAIVEKLVVGRLGFQNFCPICRERFLVVLSNVVFVPFEPSLFSLSHTLALFLYGRDTL